MSTRPLGTLLPAPPRSGFAPYRRPARTSNKLVALLLTWNARYKMRRHLSGLDDHMLADIGLTRDMAEVETRKPIWRA